MSQRRNRQIKVIRSATRKNGCGNTASCSKVASGKVIHEDHSAKTFNRPEWTNLLTDLKKRKGQIDLTLFTKWDRFSRNAGDAYQMINTLLKLEVEPQAIEQPLDLSVPENKNDACLPPGCPGSRERPLCIEHAKCNTMVEEGRP